MSYEVMAVEYFKRRLKKLSKKYKIRMNSSNTKKGKRGGFRVIYYLSNHIVYLLTIYVKAKKEKISIKEIKEALKGLDMAL